MPGAPMASASRNAASEFSRACALPPRWAKPRGAVMAPSLPSVPESTCCRYAHRLMSGVVVRGGNAVSRLARFVLQHRALVAVFWLILLVAGGVTSSTTVNRLVIDFSLPG